jgi:hypothetical protein
MFSNDGRAGPDQGVLERPVRHSAFPASPPSHTSTSIIYTACANRRHRSAASCRFFARTCASRNWRPSRTRRSCTTSTLPGAARVRPGPAGFMNPTHVVDQRVVSPLRWSGMITAVSLRPLYPIFRPVRFDRAGGARPRPRTSNCSYCVTRSPFSAEPTPRHAWTGRTERCRQPSSGDCRRACLAIVWSP